MARPRSDVSVDSTPIVVSGRMNMKSAYALFSMVVVGAVLVLLGIGGAFTIVRCGPETCIGSLEYNYATGIAGIILVVVGGAKLASAYLKRR